jgi:hypothetical protein
MQDERDRQLLRHFAASQRPLADAQFAAQVTRQLHRYSLRRALGAALHGAVRGTLTGLGIGIAAPFRLRHAGLVTLAAAGVVVWTILLSSR